MAVHLIRVIAIVLGATLTAAYLFSLYVLTFAYCYMRAANCPQGWIARTISTLAYLAVVAVIVLATRWLLRIAQRR